jgi:hypothetical protein
MVVLQTPSRDDFERVKNRPGRYLSNTNAATISFLDTSLHCYTPDEGVILVLLTQLSFVEFSISFG